MRYRTLLVLISILVWTTACAKKEKTKFTPQDSVVTPELAEDFEPVGCETAACEEACKEFPEDQRVKCAEAFRNRCFSSAPPDDFDCGEFGIVEEADEESDPGKRERQRKRKQAPTGDAERDKPTTDDLKEKEDLLMDY